MNEIKKILISKFNNSIKNNTLLFNKEDTTLKPNSTVIDVKGYENFDCGIIDALTDKGERISKIIIEDLDSFWRDHKFNNNAEEIILSFFNSKCSVESYKWDKEEDE